MIVLSTTIRTRNRALVNFRENVLHVTQSEIAEMLGIQRTTYANYESGVSNIPQRILDKLEAMGLDHTAEPDEYRNSKISVSPRGLRLSIETLYNIDAP